MEYYICTSVYEKALEYKYDRKKTIFDGKKKV